MKEEKLMEMKRRLKKSGINGVVLTIVCHSESEPHPNHPVRVSKLNGEIEIKLKFKVSPDNIKPVDQALEVLRELKDQE